MNYSNRKNNWNYDEWKVFSQIFDIQKYEIEFEPFLYQLKIKSKFQIVGNFNLPPDSIFINYRFPNQTIEKSFLNLSATEKCTPKYEKLSNCYVFQNTNFLNLSADKYFAREIAENEDIPFSINFNFDTKNLSNLQTNEDGNFSESKKYFNFLSNLKKFEINKNFQYKNSFFLKRNSYETESQQVNLAKRWTITEDEANYQVENIKFFIKNYDNISDSYIDKWFSIEKAQNQKIKIENLENSVFLNDSTGIHQIVLDPKSLFSQRNINNKIDFLYKGEIKKISDSYVENKSPKVAGIFLPWKSDGFLKSKFLLLLENQAWKFEILNNFSFKENFLISENEELEIEISSKIEDFYGNLSEFECIKI